MLMTDTTRGPTACTGRKPSEVAPDVKDFDREASARDPRNERLDEAIVSRHLCGGARVLAVARSIPIDGNSERQTNQKAGVALRPSRRVRAGQLRQT